MERALGQWDGLLCLGRAWSALRTVCNESDVTVNIYQRAEVKLTRQVIQRTWEA